MGLVRVCALGNLDTRAGAFPNGKGVGLVVKWPPLIACKSNDSFPFARGREVDSESDLDWV